MPAAVHTDLAVRSSEAHAGLAGAGAIAALAAPVAGAAGAKVAGLQGAALLRRWLGASGSALCLVGGLARQQVDAGDGARLGAACSGSIPAKSVGAAEDVQRARWWNGTSGSSGLPPSLESHVHANGARPLFKTAPGQPLAATGWHGLKGIPVARQRTSALGAAGAPLPGLPGKRAAGRRVAVVLGWPLVRGVADAPLGALAGGHAGGGAAATGGIAGAPGGVLPVCAIAGGATAEGAAR